MISIKAKVNRKFEGFPQTKRKQSFKSDLFVFVSKLKLMLLWLSRNQIGF